MVERSCAKKKKEKEKGNVNKRKGAAQMDVSICFNFMYLTRMYCRQDAKPARQYQVGCTNNLIE
jgi:hypothetical protein